MHYCLHRLLTERVVQVKDASRMRELELHDVALQHLSLRCMASPRSEPIHIAPSNGCQVWIYLHPDYGSKPGLSRKYEHVPLPAPQVDEGVLRRNANIGIAYNGQEAPSTGLLIPDGIIELYFGRRPEPLRSGVVPRPTIMKRIPSIVHNCPSQPADHSATMLQGGSKAPTALDKQHFFREGTPLRL